MDLLLTVGAVFLAFAILSLIATYLICTSSSEQEPPTPVQVYTAPLQGTYLICNPADHDAALKVCTDQGINTFMFMNWLDEGTVYIIDGDDLDANRFAPPINLGRYR